MNLAPVAVGLNVCDYVLIEEQTRKVSLIGIGKHWKAKRFPFTPPPFYVHSTVVDGQGDVTITLVVNRLKTDENIYSRSLDTHFEDKLGGKHVVFRMDGCSFPAPGIYAFILLGNGEWIAQRRMQVGLEEDT